MPVERGSSLSTDATRWKSRIAFADASSASSSSGGAWLHCTLHGLLLLPPSAFFLIGLLIWAIRAVNTEQVEEPDFRIAHHNPAEESA